MRQEDRRKEQMEYGSGRKKTVILAVVVLLLIAVMAGICSIKLKEITVTGNEKYTDEQLISLVFPDDVSRSTVFTYLREHFGKHEKIPFVEDYKLVFKGPSRAETTTLFS